MGENGTSDSSTKRKENVDKLFIIPRTLWGALPAKTKVSRNHPFKEVVYTDTDTTTCSTKQECTKLVKKLQTYHMELKGLSDIDYNFLIGGDGNIYEAGGWHLLSSSFVKDNTPEGDGEKTTDKSTELSLEVAFIGSYKEGDIPAELRKVAEKLIGYGIENKLVYVSDEETETDNDSDEGNKSDEESNGVLPNAMIKGVKKLIANGVEQKLLTKTITEYGDGIYDNYIEIIKRRFDDIVEVRKRRSDKYKNKPLVDITQMDLSKVTDSEVEEAEKRANDEGIFTIECR